MPSGPPSGITFGLHDIWDKSKGDPKTYKVEKAIVHEQYQQGEGTFPNDLALVKLATPVDTSSPLVSTIELAEPDVSFTGQMGVIAGWGLTKVWNPRDPPKHDSTPDEDKSEPLQQAEIKIHKNSFCRMRWHSHFNSKIQICAGLNMQRGACDGDSGGPLVVHDGERWRLIGVTSWVIGGCKTTEPSVFTRVTAF